MPTAFVAEMVTFDTPLALGVPLIRPVLLFIRKPFGRPLAPNVRGLFVALIWYLNGDPALPLTKRSPVIVGRATVTRMVMFALPVPPEFEAVSATLKRPEDVGVPVIRPVLLFNFKPPGKPVAP